MRPFSRNPFLVKESEKVTERYLCRKVTELGGLCYKWKSANQAGVPDRICLFPNQMTWYVELKSEGQKPSPLQYDVLARLRRLGHKVYVIDTKAKVDSLIEEIKNAINGKV